MSRKAFSRAARHDDEATDNPYELERLALIKRNRSVLASMGLLNVQVPGRGQPPAQPAKKKKRAPVDHPPGELRRSKRAGVTS